MKRRSEHHLKHLTAANMNPVRIAIKQMGRLAVRCELCLEHPLLHALLILWQERGLECTVSDYASSAVDVPWPDGIYPAVVLKSKKSGEKASHKPESGSVQHAGPQVKKNGRASEGVLQAWKSGCPS